jgi:hypothetical protein
VIYVMMTWRKYKLSSFNVYKLITETKFSAFCLSSAEPTTIMSLKDVNWCDFCNGEKLCLTLNPPTATIVALYSNASKWQMGFNSAFKRLM